MSEEIALPSFAIGGITLENLSRRPHRRCDARGGFKRNMRCRMILQGQSARICSSAKVKVGDRIRQEVMRDGALDRDVFAGGTYNQYGYEKQALMRDRKRVISHSTRVYSAA